MTTQQPLPAQDIARLQNDLVKLVRVLQDDLRERCDLVAEVGHSLRADFELARTAERTSESFTTWRENYLNQVAVAWVLATVFIRYLEDNELLDQVWLAGLGPRRNQVLERYSDFFRTHPELNDRDYFLHVFDLVAALPGCSDIFGREKNPLWKVGISGDGAKKLREFWQEVDPATGTLARELKGADSRFLGDLYQNLSEEARSRYALLQTPVFVESFILDRTLEPAIREFGLEEVRLIDPTCGSGHFLLGAFERLLGHWRRQTSSDNPRVLARKAVEAVYGIDINPFAVAIARFRLMLAYLSACGFRRLHEMSDIKVHVATGDSLLHGNTLCSAKGWGVHALRDWLPEAFAIGDFNEAASILQLRYHAVVGNPPYIPDRDKAHSAAVRESYRTAYRQFSLAVPFKEKFWDLAVAAHTGQRAGFVGMITSNAFMRREFGGRLIEEFFPRVDLTHVIDASGAYIPGHGTPTAILIGRNRAPKLPVVRCVMGIRGENETPERPSEGPVWRSIRDLVESPGAQNDYVSVIDVERSVLGRHPWSLGGGGASELKKTIDACGPEKLSEKVDCIGFMAITGEDEVMVFDEPMTPKRLGLEQWVSFGIGSAVRDWVNSSEGVAVYPYGQNLELLPLAALPQIGKYLWSYREGLFKRKRFGTSMRERCLSFYEWREIYTDRLKTSLTITFPQTATHNHFVLSRGNMVFDQTSPIIKMRASASENDHLVLIGLLNSSLACFWLRQVCHSKGTASDTGVLQGDPERFRYVFGAASLADFPIPSLSVLHRENIIKLSNALDQGGVALKENWKTLISQSAKGGTAGIKSELEGACKRRAELRDLMVRWQEELDWLIYEIYGLVDPLSKEHSQIYNLEPASMSPLRQEHRPYRLLNIENAPTSWSSSDLIRRHTISQDPTLRLVECPDHKRRWFKSAGSYNSDNLDDDTIIHDALNNWILDRIEGTISTCEQLISCTRVADQLSRDAEFLSVLSLYKKRDDYHLVSEVTELVLPEGIPYLSACRYSESGLRIRGEWEKTWELQRRQDAGESIDIVVPPKYGSKDFRKSEYWRLRGKLDVPKERFILYPGAEREADASPVIGWAGWNHLQRAAALATYFLARKEEDGWGKERLQPLLAGLAELLPWLKQWHNDVDPATGERLGDFYESFLREEARALGLTPDKLADCPCPDRGGVLKKAKGKKK